MRVSDIQVRESSGFAELHAKVEHDTHWVWGDAPFELWYRYPAEFGQHLSVANGDPFLAALLVPAMLLGEDLHIEASISPMLLSSARNTIQDIYRSWNREMKRVRVVAAESVPARTAGQRFAGLFFSMGVDSSYSLLKNLRDHSDDSASVSHLITVEGFDVYLWESQRFVPMLASIREVAAATGKQVLPITTNLRELSDRTSDWPALYHGAALASTVLALGPAFARVHVSATVTYSHLFPFGSHPLLDPLWSTESMAIVHDGCEARRVDKIRLIAQADAPAVLHNLRVCATSEVTDAYNCGQCPKCVNTMIGLHISGALGRCPTLPHTIDPAHVRTFRNHNIVRREYMLELVDELGASEMDVAIKQALLESLASEPA